MSIDRARVLLVEDDAGLRVGLSALLAQAGYEVRTAWDGVSALEEIGLGVPDLIVSDLHTPRMSGFDLLLLVSRQLPEIRLIAMSGAFSSKRIREGVTADGFYEKGTHPVLLLQLVNSMMLRDTRSRNNA
jgi:CheY-like chemotaxis protein